MNRWFLTVLVQLDELTNAFLGGYAGETISYRFAINAQDGGAFGCWFCRIIQRWLPDHCDLSKPSKAMRLSRPSKLAADKIASRKQ